MRSGAYQVRVQDKVLEYQIVRSPRAKNVGVRIFPSEVRVVLPRGVPVRAAVDFMERVKGRVLRARERVLLQDERLKSLTDIAYVDGAVFPVLGKPVTLHVIRERRTRARLTFDGCLVVRVDDSLSSSACEQQVRRKVEAWIKDLVYLEAQRLAAALGNRLGIVPSGIRVKAPRRQWGSCGSNRVINLNWRLGLFPRRVLWYVVVHEVAHLRYMNHSPAFWRLVKMLMPDYEVHREWLRFRGGGEG